jgi:hypothetical protein
MQNFPEPEPMSNTRVACSASSRAAARQATASGVQKRRDTRWMSAG